MPTKKRNYSPRKSPGTKTRDLRDQCRPIQTIGQFLPAGESIELIRDAETGRLNLQFFDREKSKFAPRVEYAGREYVPPEVHFSILQAMTLPAKGTTFGSARQLLDDISRTVVRYTSLSDHLAKAVARFVLATWVVDAIAIAPWLRIVGPDTIAGGQLVQILACLCRHALPLTDVSVGAICSLPLGWHPTLVIQQPELSARLQGFLNCTRNPNHFIPRNGELLDFHIAVVTYSRLSHRNGDIMSSIEVPVVFPMRQLEILDENTQRRIADDYQPKLLGYRCANYEKIRSSKFDAPDLTSPMRGLARGLGACTPDDEDLQAETVHLLAAREADIQASKWTDLNVTIVEAILGFIHEGKETCIYVGDIAKAAEAILLGRGERRQVEAREVGDKLRDLDLKTEPRDSRGFKLLLTEAIRRHVHELARDFDAPSIQHPMAGCPCCIHPAAEERKGERTASG